jgi:beta-1,4-N-acetylglucosaminyltransferase
MRVFVTVGSTKFDSLIQEVLSPRILTILRKRGCTSLTIQCGNSTFSYSSLIAEGKTANLQLEGIEIEIWKFKPSLREDYEKADFIISHAGK